VATLKSDFLGTGEIAFSRQSKKRFFEDRKKSHFRGDLKKRFLGDRKKSLLAGT
jgi:hypothetical protein